MTVKELCDNFIAAWQPTVRKRTFKVRTESFLLYLQPISDIEVENLTIEILLNHITSMRNRLQASTVSQWQNFLKRCFAYAMQHNIIKKDVTSELLGIPYTVKPVSYVTPDQFYTIVEKMKTFTSIEDLDEKILFLEILFLTGMRHSECRALQVRKIDFVENKITIDKSLYCDYIGVWELTDPKTRTSFRDISIPSLLTDKIERFVTLKNKKADDFLFSYEDGNPRLFNFAKWPLERACKKLNIWISAHGLRHSHATFLRQSGLDLEKIQKRLGHSNLTITLHYSHAKLSDNDVVDAIEKSCYPLIRGEEHGERIA